MKADYLTQHLSAPHDANGNPRRLYYVINVETLEEKVYDEGYVGWEGLPPAVRLSYFPMPPLEIKASRYKRLLKELGQ